MNMYTHHTEFMNPQMTVMTPADLGIPPSPPVFKAGQHYDIVAGDQFLIYAPGKITSGSFSVLRWHEGHDGQKRIELQNVKSNSPLYLDTWQIGHLERHGLIRPLASAGGKRDQNLPGSALCLTNAQRAKAEYWLAYVQAALDECADFNNGKPSRKLMKRGVERLAERRGENPPSMSSIYNKLEKSRLLLNFDPLLAMAPNASSGYDEPRYCERTEEAIRKAVTLAWSDPKGTWKSVRATLKAWSEEGGEYFDLANLVIDIGDAQRMLSRRTIQRRFWQVDKFTRDGLRYGYEYAARVHARRIRQERPERPLDVVDVDHTTLGIVVYDDVRGIGFGRPDLVLFRDRHSGVVLGWAISFGPPSLKTFLEGLLHALLPKDDGSLPPGISYPWHGRPVALGVDNAKHLIGMPIREAAIELGFQITPYRPAHPWEKGALEHLFHIMNIQLVDRLPGATTMSPDERKKFDAEKLKAVPQISLSELNGFLAYYFATVHHARSHEGLGELHTFQGIPSELWEKGIKNAPHRPLVDRDIMVRLAGDTTLVTVQPDGVRWEYLVYQGAELEQLTLNPAHKFGTKQHKATEYKAVRDPSDLGRIWVHNPYNGHVIEVPISSSMAKYADGLRLYQHRRIVAHNNEMNRRNDDIEALNTSMVELENQLLEIHAKRRKHETATKLARFISGQRERIRRTRAVEIATSGAGRMDYAAPTTTSVPTVQVSLPVAEEATPSQTPETPVDKTPERDIDAIRAKHEGWE
ncbi:DDE-type integrase/transposase/recombinase [Rhizobium leguminosarum]|uniref:DDE-type integrase/transposase/recombinase n=1 Tax=Rhizobium leguminosarum TaxID=384 RepID=UPI001441C4DF|nr:DDE-type integrase/transposase/recombinase [Rhizobium leguminosarum]